MLRVSAITGLTKPKTAEANVVLVEDMFGNPLVVVYETQPGVTFIARSNDSDFNRILQGLGLDKCVVAANLQTNPVESGARLLYDPSNPRGSR